MQYPIKIDKDEVVRYLGCREQSFASVDKQLQQQIRDAIIQLRQLIQPKYVYKTFSAAVCPEGISLDGGIVLLGKDIAHHLKSCGSCILMAATLGHQLDREIAKLQLTNMSQSVVLNAVAIAAIEQVCDLAQEEIACRILRPGESFTSRFSPGYGDMPLAQQYLFAQVLDLSRKVGIGVTESFILVPSKSVTAVIGIIKELDKDMKQGKCAYCRLRDNCDFSRCQR